MIPRWAYTRLRDTRAGEPPEPIAIEKGEARRTAKQVKEYMLCGDCEQKLGVYDNEVSRLACNASQFPAIAHVGRVIATNQEGTELAESGSLDLVRLAYFACSVVWRGHAARSVPDCNLGPLAESFRRFLNGESGPPAKVVLTLSLLRDEPGSDQMASIISLPQTQRSRPRFNHQFALCGLYFAVSTGNDGSLLPSVAATDHYVALVAPAKYK
ncbi:MAG TPA: hypothetical protein VMF89_07525, partial [Polyangiales bacterium]|nr:hypothetical protein [Polyangiales bacterium]